MSQEKVFKILEELGGKARFSDIANLAREKYPNATLHQYIGGVLKKLEKWGYAERKNGFWVTKKKYKGGKTLVIK